MKTIPSFSVLSFVVLILGILAPALSVAQVTNDKSKEKETNKQKGASKSVQEKQLNQDSKLKEVKPGSVQKADIDKDGKGENAKNNKKKPASGKDDAKKARGEGSGEINPDENQIEHGLPFDENFRPELPPQQREFDPSESGPTLLVNLSLKDMKCELVSGDRHNLSVVVKNAGSSEYAGNAKVIFAREGFGELLPDEPGGSVKEGPKRGHKQLGARKVPKLKPGGEARLSVEVDNLASYYAHLETDLSDSVHVINASRQTRVEFNGLKFGGALPVDLDQLLDALQIKDNVSQATIRLHNGRGTMNIPNLIEEQTFEIPDGPLVFKTIGTSQIDYFVNDINSSSMSLAYAEKSFKIVVNFETRDPECRVGGNAVSDFIYPDVNTDRFRIDIEMPLSFSKSRQLFEIGNAKVDVSANWSFDTIPGAKQVLDSFLKDVNDQIELELLRTVNRDLAPQIEWQLNHQLRDTLLPLDDKYGNVGQITEVDFREGSQLTITYIIPN